MALHRRFVFTSFGLLAALLVLGRCNSSPKALTQSDSLVSPDRDSADGEENVCQTSAGSCSNEDGAENQCVSFSRDIQPIFENRCVRCHNADTTRGQLNLSACASYANLVNQPTSPACQATVPDSIRVVPCDPAGSMLWRKTKPDPSRCGNPMPLGTPGLGEIAPDEFLLIETWIAQGAQDN